MKKYEKIIGKMIKDFAEKGLQHCENHPDRKILDYLIYMGIVVVKGNEQGNPNFKYDEAIKGIIISIVDNQWKLYRESKKGAEIIAFYENKVKAKEVINAPEKLEEFLLKVTSQKMIDELFFDFVKNGDLNSVKRLVEKKSPKIKSDVDKCIIAVKNNQPEILEYLFRKDKYQIKHEQSYMGIYIKKAMEYDAKDVFEKIIKTNFDIENEKLLSHAIFYKQKDYAYKLVDLGAKLEEIDSRVDKVFLEDITTYYNKKLLNDNLETDLSNSPKKKSAKI